MLKRWGWSTTTTARISWRRRPCAGGTGGAAGIIKCLTISCSVDEIKKLSRMTSLSNFFKCAYAIFRRSFRTAARPSGICPRPRASSSGHRSLAGPPPSAQYDLHFHLYVDATRPVRPRRQCPVGKIHQGCRRSDSNFRRVTRGTPPREGWRGDRFLPGRVQFYWHHDPLGT